MTVARLANRRAEVRDVRRFSMRSFRCHTVLLLASPVFAMHAAGVSPLQAPFRSAVAPTRGALASSHATVAASCCRRAAFTVRAGWFDNFGASTDRKKDEAYRIQQARVWAVHGSRGARPAFHIRQPLTASLLALLGDSVRPSDGQEERRGREAEGGAFAPRPPRLPRRVLTLSLLAVSRRWPAT